MKRTIEAGVSTRNGSKLSGLRPGNANLDLNRQWRQSKDPQGMYIFGADGTPYGFCNDHDPADIEQLMDLSLERFKAAPPKPVVISDADKNAPWSVLPPPTAQVLQVFARIPSPPETSTRLNKGVGRDFCWIYQDELHEVAKLAAAGKEFPLPATIARRIARFHLVDDVRGTPNMWEKSEIKQLSLNAKPVGTGQLTLAGEFALRTRSGRRGYSGTLDGTIRFDPETGAWTCVRLLADGVAFGAGTYTPNQPKKPYRLLVGVLDTTLPEARIVPPEEVATQNRDTRYREP